MIPKVIGIAFIIIFAILAIFGLAAMVFVAIRLLYEEINNKTE